MGSQDWAETTAAVFNMLAQEDCAEVAKPEWWNDEGLKALSARVVRVAPDYGHANQMRAFVLSGRVSAFGRRLLSGPRSLAELREAAAHYERTAALHPAPAMKAELTSRAERCRAAVRLRSMGINIV